MSYINRNHRSSTVPPLSPEQIREHRLITSPTVADFIIERLAGSNPGLTEAFKLLLRNHNLGVHTKLLETLLFRSPNSLDTIAIVLTGILSAISCYARIDYNNYSAAIFEAVQELRAPLPLFSAREDNVCTYCGGRGHFPCECIYYKCDQCDSKAPGHYPQNCPLRPEEHNSQTEGHLQQTPPSQSTDSDAPEGAGDRTTIVILSPLQSRGQSLFPSSSDSDDSPSSPAHSADSRPSRPVNRLSTTRGTARILRRSARLRREGEVRFITNPSRPGGSTLEIPPSPSYSPELGEEINFVVQQTDQLSSEQTPNDLLNNLE